MIRHRSHHLHCLVVTGIFPPDIGGPARYVSQIATGLVKRGISCDIITLSDQNEKCEVTYPFHIRRVLRQQNLLYREIRTCWHILTQAARSDVLFVNGLYWEAALVNLITRKPMLMKIVSDEVWERASRRGWTTNDLETFQSRGTDWRITLTRFMRNFAIGQADRIIVPSNFTKRLAEGWSKNLPPIEVIPNAVEKRNNNLPYQLPGHWMGLKKLVTVGRLIPLKRVDQVLHVVSSIPESALVIVGDGPERKKLAQQARKLRIQERVLFTGALPIEMVHSVLRVSDIFVLASSVENFPHVILEAMAAGLPVVATRVGGVPEIVQHGMNGLLIEPNKPTSLREAIQGLLADTKLRERIRKGVQDTLARFSVERVADRVSSILWELCRKKT